MTAALTLLGALLLAPAPTPTPESAAEAPVPKDSPARAPAPKARQNSAVPKDSPARDAAVPKDNPAGATVPKDSPARDAAILKDSPARDAPVDSPAGAAVLKDSPARGAAVPPNSPGDTAVPKDSPADDAAPVPADSPALAPDAAPSGEPSAPAPDVLPPTPAPSDAPAAASAEPAAEMSAPVTDGPVAVTAKISPDPSQVGDLIKLELTAAYPAGYTVNLPLGLTLAPLHLVSVDESEPESTGQGFRKVYTITVQHFAVGEARVPAFPLTYIAPDGAVQTVQVPPTSFTVSSLLANEPDPKRQGEDPPVSLEYPNRRAEIIIYSAAAALLVGLIGGLLWARWRRRPRAVILPPPVPAHVVAYQQLEELQKADLVAKGAHQDYYLQLTEIAKGYIEGRFGIDALDRTTDELRRALQSAAAQIAPLKPDELVRFLQACDLVKFARFAPPDAEAQAALAEVRTMVDATAPKAEAPKPEPKPEVKPEPKTDKPEAA